MGVLLGVNVPLVNVLAVTALGHLTAVKLLAVPRFVVQPFEGKVVLIDNELDERMLRRWLRGLSEDCVTAARARAATAAPASKGPRNPRLQGAGAARLGVAVRRALPGPAPCPSGRHVLSTGRYVRAAEELLADLVAVVRTYLPHARDVAARSGRAVAAARPPRRGCAPARGAGRGPAAAPAGGLRSTGRLQQVRLPVPG